MKRLFLTLLVLVSANYAIQAMDLKRDEVITKHLTLEITQAAKDNNAFITWELTGDWNSFDYNFSQGSLKKNLYTIYANDYQSYVNGGNGITFTLTAKSKAKTGNYTLMMTVKETSNELEFEANKMNLSLDINYDQGPIPFPWTLVCIIAAILLIIIIVLNAKSKFPSGLIQFGNIEVDLKGKKKVSAREELGDTLAAGVDVVFVKKTFGSYNGPMIKKIDGCELKRVDGSIIDKGEILYEGDTLYGMTDSLGKDIVIRCS